MAPEYHQDPSAFCLSLACLQYLPYVPSRLRDNQSISRYHKQTFHLQRRRAFAPVHPFCVVRKTSPNTCPADFLSGPNGITSSWIQSQGFGFLSCRKWGTIKGFSARWWSHRLLFLIDHLESHMGDGIEGWMDEKQRDLLANCCKIHIGDDEVWTKLVMVAIEVGDRKINGGSWSC